MDIRSTKRSLTFLVTAGLVLGLAAAAPGWAQPERTERPLSLYIDIGYINLNEPPHWIALGPEIEWRLAKPVSINADVAIWLQDSFRSTVRVVPGLAANVRFNRFFVGAGAVWRIPEWAIDTTGKIVPKIQAGLLMGPAKLALTVHLPGGNNDAILGMTIGTRIGRPGGREPD
jgi:hypothetical protein